jgi:hypothetical protein
LIQKGLIQNFCSEEIINNIEVFFEHNKAIQATLSIQQGIELIKSNINFMKTQQQEFRRFFDSENFY